MGLFGKVGHFFDITFVVLAIHLGIMDIFFTMSDVEKRFGAAVPASVAGLLSSVLAAYCYYLLLPVSGQVLLPTALWLFFYVVLTLDTLRLNNEDGAEALFPYKGPMQTRFWFMPQQ